MRSIHTNLHLSFLIVLVFILLSCAKEDITQEEIPNINDNYAKAYETTKVIETESLMSSMDSTLIKLDANMMDLNDVVVGDVIVGDISEDYPTGFLRKVLSIDKTNSDEIILSTRKASLDEAFEEYTFKFNFDGFYRSIDHCEDIEDINISLLTFDNMEVCVGANFISEKKIIDDKPIYRMGFEDFNMPVKGRISVSEALTLSKSPMSVAKPTKNITFLAGGIPVNIVLTIDIRLGYEVSIGGSAQIAFETNLLTGDHLIEINDNGELSVINNPSDNIDEDQDNDQIVLNAVIDGAVKMIFEVEASGEAYDEDIASISPLDARVEVEPVFEITALTDCAVGTRLDIFFKYIGGGKLSLLNKWSLDWNYFNKSESFTAFEYCSSCLYDITINDEIYECNPNGTPDDDSDDFITYSQTVSIFEQLSGNSIGAERAGYYILVDNVYYPSENNPELFTYDIINIIELTNEPHYIRFVDATQLECMNLVKSNLVCFAGEIEELDEGGGSPTNICNNNIVDSDGSIYCYLDVCYEDKCLRWLRRNARKNIGSSSYVNNDSDNWKLGRLYSWDDVESGQICPEGYRVASTDDYFHLIEAVEAFSSSNHASHLKADYSWAGGGNGDNGEIYSRYFELFPNGYYTVWNDQFQEVGYSANLWTTEPLTGSTNSIETINVLADSDDVNFTPVVKDAFRLGVRCVCEQDCD